MTRTIKFRAWDGNQMHEDVHAVNGMAYVDSEVKYDTPHREVYPIENSAIMQFTGLLDKNGKEIYEGDILICIDPNAESLERLYDICSVEMDAEECAFLLKERDYKQRWRFNEQYDELEVIGNIYETPELLK